MFNLFKKNKILSVILSVIVISSIIYFFMNLDLELPSQHSESEDPTINPGDKTVFLRIDCKILFTDENKGIISDQMLEFLGDEGIILEKEEFLLKEDDTVFSLLLRVVRQKNMHMEFTGDPDKIGSLVYIKGINHLYEYDYGPLSGWVFRVNDEFSQSASSKHLLHDGDYIEIMYTLDLGADVGNDFGGD